MTAPTTESRDHLASVLADAVIDDREAGIYRANRRIFTDEEVFELEMKHIFEGNWIYLAHESQVPNNNDYYTTHIGRQPVFIARNQARDLGSSSFDASAVGRENCDAGAFSRCDVHGVVDTLRKVPCEIAVTAHAEVSH